MHRGDAVGQRALQGAQRADLRGPRRGHADRDRRRRAAAHRRGQHHARGRLHQRAAAPAGQPGRVRPLLERRPGDRGRAGRAGRQLAVPVRPAAVARDPDHAVRAGHRHPAGRAEAAGGAAPGVVRRALDHLGVRPVRGEPPVLPGAAADLRGRGPAGGARPRRLPAAGRDEPAQRDRLPLEPAGLRGRRRQAAPAGGEPGAAGRPDGRRRHGQRGVLLRPGPRRWPRRSGRSGPRCRSPPPAENLHEAARHGLDAQLYWPGLGEVPVAELVLRRLLPLAREGLRPLGRGPGPRRPPARHHRAALPDRPDRRRLADRHGRGDRRAQRRWTGREALRADDPALHRAHAHQRAGAHLAGGGPRPAVGCSRRGPQAGQAPQVRDELVVLVRPGRPTWTVSTSSWSKPGPATQSSTISSRWARLLAQKSW